MAKKNKIKKNKAKNSDRNSESGAVASNSPTLSKTSVVLFPRLVAVVGLDWIHPSDIEIFKKMLGSDSLKSSEDTPQNPDFVGSLEDILKPRVALITGLSEGIGMGGKSYGTEGYWIENTGCDYDQRVQKLICGAWEGLGASPEFLAILQAAQRQSIAKIAFEPGGMIVERRKFPILGPVPKGGIKRKDSKRLLESLKMMYEDMWPIEQLSSILSLHMKVKHVFGKGKRRKRRVPRF